ncbi:MULTISPECIES: DUF262 domain-containing protein [Acinetobacter]|uniref:DUF262 domain-containing protein n=1 Tax=Acinetobacter TaxID=469 RepID=UPI0002CE72DF|nr:DUF262 domain-containing protein [Acinetobacter towneri]ENV69366.1 hypothetical protein F947_01786 [Acinetobacter towneri DSM 14962 = CIP 107472]
MKASQQLLSNILNSSSANEHYHIPKFQRPYSWQKDHWEKFLDDIEEDDLGHFIGSIICLFDESSTEPNTDKVFELIDGQQRFTTISIFLAALRKKLNIEIEKSKSNLDEDEFFEYKATLINISNQLIKKLKSSNNPQQKGVFSVGNDNFILRFLPSTQNDNESDYKYILSLCGVLPESVKKPNYFNLRRMSKAYSYFLERLEEKNLDDLKNIAQKVNAITMVHIQVSSNSDAFRLFDTLNNRGLPLSAIDIIKNKMLATLTSKYNQNIDSAYDQWQDLINNIEGLEDRFLRQYFNAFNHLPLISMSNKKATTSQLIKIYEELIEKRDTQKLFSDLIAKSNIYKSLVEPDTKTIIGQNLQEFNYINTAPTYTLLMYLMSLDSKFFSNDYEQTLLEILEFLQKFAIRRNLTDMPKTRALDQINIDVIENCHNAMKDGKKIDINLIKSSFLNNKHKPASIDQVKEILSSNDFYQNSMSRYLLIKLDSLWTNRQYNPNLWERNNKGDYIWTIEHVLPQSENISKDWEEMLKKNANNRDIKDIHQESVHKIGNLTLSAYNSKLSKGSLTQKQKLNIIKLGGLTINIGYQNGLAINTNLSFNNQSLSNVSDWTDMEIMKRGHVMVDLLIKTLDF